jgi:hypothetical protein
MVIVVVVMIVVATLQLDEVARTMTDFAVDVTVRIGARPQEKRASQGPARPHFATL